jgi:hypothetical protein
MKHGDARRLRWQPLQSDIDEPDDGHDSLRRDRGGQLGHDLLTHVDGVDSGHPGRLDQVVRGAVMKQDIHRRTRGERLADA